MSKAIRQYFRASRVKITKTTANQEDLAKLTEKWEVGREREQLIGNLAASHKEGVSLTASVSSLRDGPGN